ncbi:MAG: hypothetical protein E6I29_10935 [Chloroflexi bacterium]|nr:MAG: hypothetical protein E6I29_10935 [Chloroflexota bacterium]
MHGPSSDVSERLLVDLPDVRVMGLLHGASNYTFLTRLGPHPPSGLRAVYKPARGESPLWDFEAGTLYQREVAAYELSKVLGWPRIPPTVVREKAPHGVGAMQLFIEADGRHFLGESTARAETWVRVALFDVKLRTVMWEFSGDPLPGELCGDVERALVELERGPLRETMQRLISQGELRALRRRLRGVLLPQWRFPEPTSAWSIPWPPV